MKKRSAFAALVVVGGCMPTPPAPPAPHSATEVAASFGKTWDALIDRFADKNIPIKTIERSSGLIATDPLGAEGMTGVADCGKSGVAGAPPKIPTSAIYSAVVRGDSAHSTIRVSVRWTRTGPSYLFGQYNTIITEDCSSLGTWETTFEQSVKAKAEGKGAAAIHEAIK